MLKSFARVLMGLLRQLMCRKVIALVVGDGSSHMSVCSQIVKFGNALGSIHEQSPWSVVNGPSILRQR